MVSSRENDSATSAAPAVSVISAAPAVSAASATPAVSADPAVSVAPAVSAASVAKEVPWIKLYQAGLHCAWVPQLLYNSAGL